jgi:osomolarity two-component system response regulator SSK1
MSKDPSVQELTQFAEFLKGRRVVLHTAEHSAFAGHLTGALTTWGIDISHMPLQRDEHEATSSTRPPSRDAGSGSDHSNHLRPGSPEGSKHSTDAPPTHEQPSHFIVIDDDIDTLRRQLALLRNAAPPINLHLSNTLLSKRPQLQNRRTRSSQHLYKTTGERPVQTAIVHFATLSNYRQIRDLVQSVLRSLGSLPPPEVLVVPKPAGMRRFLTALYVAVRRPVLDPFFSPIATSPSSPGGVHYFASARPSPASSLQNEFEIAAGAALAGQEVRPPSVSGSVAGGGGATPPVKPQSGPPSPMPMPPEALEYITRTAAGLGGSPSSGYVIQTLDGKPSGLFFQPQGSPPYRSNYRSGSRTETRAEATPKENGNQQGATASPTAAASSSQEAGPGLVSILPIVSSSSSSSGGIAVSSPTLSFGERPQVFPLQAFPIAARPLDMVLGEGARSTGDLHVGLPPQPPHLPRILSAPAGISKGSSPASKSTSPPNAPSPPPGRQEGSTSPGSATPRRTGGGGGGGTKPVTAPIKTSPPTSPPGPVEASQSPKSSREPATSPVATKTRSARSKSIAGGATAPRRPSRKLTNSLVPPINVLIVEGMVQFR